MSTIGNVSNFNQIQNTQYTQSPSYILPSAAQDNAGAMMAAYPEWVTGLVGTILLQQSTKPCPL